MSDSSSGGYLLPTTTPPPDGLTLEQFIQTVIVGISGYVGDLVRPRWQIAPPKQPDALVDWIAFGIQEDGTSGYAFVSASDGSIQTLGRQTSLQIQMSFYGPNCVGNAAAFRDGFQIQQNLEAMTLANMGFTDCSQITRSPELVNERWFNRTELTLVLALRVQRSYQVLSFASAGGIIHTQLNGAPYDFNWQTPEAP